MRLYVLTLAGVAAALGILIAAAWATSGPLDPLAAVVPVLTGLAVAALGGAVALLALKRGR